MYVVYVFIGFLVEDIIFYYFSKIPVLNKNIHFAAASLSLRHFNNVFAELFLFNILFSIFTILTCSELSFILFRSNDRFFSLSQNC